MKTGLGLYLKYRKLVSYFNLYRFTLRKIFIGFDVANNFLNRTDKDSIILILKKNGASLGNNCEIETGIIFHNCKKYSNLTIGDNCHIGKNCFFDLRDKVIIGKNVVISMQTTFITHIDLGKSPLKIRYPSSSGQIILEDNCYIGARTTLLKDVRIVMNSVVAAGSVVIKSIEKPGLIGGLPAKLLKQ